MSLPPPSPQATAVVTGATSGIGEPFARPRAARGPTRSGFQEASDAAVAERRPAAPWVPAERVAADGLDAAEAGRRLVIPGGPGVRVAFAGTRHAPTSSCSR
jgi:short-subunit dehydrogenase